jgi:dUTP pyrophosphatase
MKSVQIQIKKAGHAEDLPLPAYMSDSASGMDLLAAVEADVTVEPGQRVFVPTGVHVAIPEGFEGQVRPRSGLALRHGVTVLNTPGTIDADYRGEVGVILANLGDKPFKVTRGDRVAQMVIAPVSRASLAETDTLPKSRRDKGGFGHTDASAENTSP